MDALAAFSDDAPVLQLNQPEVRLQSPEIGRADARQNAVL
jgi:hypothetical protein